jgi:hypothetical protein
MHLLKCVESVALGKFTQLDDGVQWSEVVGHVGSYYAVINKLYYHDWHTPGPRKSFIIVDYNVQFSPASFYAEARLNRTVGIRTLGLR